MTPRAKMPDHGDAKTKRGRPGLPSPVADRIREVIDELLGREPYRGHGGLTRLAGALKMSQPALTLIRQGGGVSPETGLRVAKLAGLDPSELLAGAYVGIAIGGKHPNLEVCLAYHGSRWSPAAVAAVRANLWPDEVSPEEWARRLDQTEKALASMKERGKHGTVVSIDTSNRGVRNRD